MGSAVMDDVGMMSFALKALNGLLPRDENGGGGDSPWRKARMEEFVGVLEEERRKMEGFRRELPLTIVIITDVIHEIKEEVIQRREGVVRRPALEQQFLETLERRGGEDEEQKGAEVEQERSDKMIEAAKTFQLWNSDRDCDSVSRKNTIERVGESDPKPPLPLFRAAAAAPTVEGRPQQMQVPLPLPMRGLSFVTPGIASSGPFTVEHHTFGSPPPCGMSLVPPIPNAPLEQQQHQQGPKKTRRCWSAELHRKFLRALDDLGGSQAATPKQIRELMNVDGLTNDEVKSHLQKYRLHMRKVCPRASKENWPVGALDFPSLSSPDDGIARNRRSSPSGSPQGPLELALAEDRAFPISRCDGFEEDRRSESYGWEGQRNQRSIEV